MGSAACTYGTFCNRYIVGGEKNYSGAQGLFYKSSLYKRSCRYSSNSIDATRSKSLFNLLADILRHAFLIVDIKLFQCSASHQDQVVASRRLCQIPSNKLQNSPKLISGDTASVSPDLEEIFNVVSVYLNRPDPNSIDNSAFHVILIVAMLGCWDDTFY
ncbi:hypothetical protein MHU86_21031 [Fragilaria crotonensis]|nr:hypothetical protein MHU86_21031 [Fragilaria crotonensis]